MRWQAVDEVIGLLHKDFSTKRRIQDCHEGRGIHLCRSSVSAARGGLLPSCLFDALLLDDLDMNLRQQCMQELCTALRVSETFGASGSLVTDVLTGDLLVHVIR